MTTAALASALASALPSDLGIRLAAEGTQVVVRDCRFRRARVVARLSVTGAYDWLSQAAVGESWRLELDDALYDLLGEEVVEASRAEARRSSRSRLGGHRLAVGCPNED